MDRISTDAGEPNPTSAGAGFAAVIAARKVGVLWWPKILSDTCEQISIVILIVGFTDYGLMDSSKLRKRNDVRSFIFGVTRGFYINIYLSVISHLSSLHVWSQPPGIPSGEG